MKKAAQSGDLPNQLQLETDYDTLSKRINKFIQWVEDNFDPRYTVQEPDFSEIEDYHPATGNRKQATD